ETRGRGLGTVLYRALVDLVREQGVKAAYALVTVPNAASEHLHEAFGFTCMGVQKNAGYTCGAWRDVAWLVLALAPFDAEPEPVVPFPTLASERPETVRSVLARANACAKG
ncbi:N-acetyltransferase family protein, partial [Paraeggerthella sp.]